MTDTINAIGTAGTSISATSQASTTSALSSDFETFLQMLTAQARYQDPLEPLDSAQYAAQLAQFSSVEQQVQTNDLLSAMRDQMGSSNMAQFAGWIGLEARTTQEVYFGSDPIDLTLEPAAIATEAELVVYDGNGAEIQRLPISADPSQTSWAGVDSSGAPLPAGLYRFEVESFANDGLVATTEVETYSRVTEARVQDGQTVLVLQGGALVDAGQVTALRLPS